MIQPSALPAVSGLPALGELTPAPGIEGVESADFSALLAIEAESLTAPGGAAQLPAPSLSAAPSEAPLLPEGGKSLPGGLPVAAPMPQTAPAEALPQAPSPRLPALVTVRVSRLPLSAQTPQAESGSEDVPSEAVATPPLAMPQPALPLETPPVLATALPEAARTAGPLIAETNPASPLPAADPQPLRPEPRAATLPAQPQPPAQVATAAPQPAPIAIAVSLVAPTAIAAEAPLPLPAEAVATRLEVKAQIAAPPLAGERDPLPVQAPSRSSRPAIADPAAVAAKPATPAAIQPLAEPSAPMPVAAAPTAQPQVAATVPVPTEAAPRPHDFAQLVDRLVAARELAQPQAFAVAVQHGEFGPIQLRFRHDGEALSVALANSDPDFARAVSAAPPLTVAAPAANEFAGQRSDTAAQQTASNGHSAQQRGPSPERREDRSGPADNPAPARQGEQSRSRRSGIFA